MLEQAGFKQANPTNGRTTGRSGATSAARHPQGTGQRVYAVGQPMGVESTDSFQSFYTSWTPITSSWSTTTASCWSTIQVRQGLIGALKDYTDTMSGLHAASSTLEGSDNNVAFHNKTIVMTHTSRSRSRRSGLTTQQPALTRAARRAEGV